MAIASIYAAGEVSPKLAPMGEPGRAAWFRYYAGFSLDFARSMLLSFAKPGHVVLDPWNGTGTTTYAASLLGIDSIGIDANPAMVLVARAREISAARLTELEGLLNRDLGDIPVSRKRKRLEPLDAWFAPCTSNLIRGLLDQLMTNLNERSDFLKSEQAFVHVLMSRVVRKYLREFIGSNPTWIKVAEDGEQVRIPRRHFVKTLREELHVLVTTGGETPESSHGHSSIRTGSSMELDVESESVDLVLTSPPYCTRIDYARATLPELAMMGIGVQSAEFKELRQTLLGTTTVPPKHPNRNDNWGSTCCRFLDAVSRHSSRASAVYYLKNHLQYFSGLYRSIEEISRVLTRDGNAVLVVQDSYYKELHNDLPSMVIEMAEKHALGLVGRHDVHVKTTKAIINRGARGYRRNFGAIESILHFRKFGN